MTDPEHQPIVPEPHRRDDEAHDVLAAEEFAMPAPAEAAPERPIALPRDPAGDERPHDILAAEEFAMPAPLHGREVSDVPQTGGRSRRGPLLGALGLGVLALLLRRRSRRT